MSGALEHIKILDLSRVLAGPYCTMILGDMGADIIKVEAPGGSDETRKWGPPFKNNVSAYYLCANRNKKSITLNLKTDEGVAAIKELVKESDVIINNFKTGTMHRLGLDYETLAKINPAIVFCSITGFGETGPYKDMPGYDFIIQAMSGLMSITGDKESGPQKMGVAITDILTGLYACIGIQGALLERTVSGKGQKLDISLYDSAVSSLVNIGSNYLMTEEIPRPLGNQHANIVPYQSFKTLDGEMVIAIGNDSQFKALCSILQKYEYSMDDRFQTNPDRVANRDILVPLLQDILIKNTTAHWQQECQKNNIPCGPIQNLDEVVKDPQLQARNMFIDCKHPTAGQVKMIGSPLKFSRTPISVRHHPPNAGEHNEAIVDKLVAKTNKK
ncbi:CaiB/BaiF CoA-transferase family protein [Virgibacillus sp. SK37]|uniref:CaiB/BaiF CoA transferase family protein n=1 Tax=Virgibacillus sp. SK37 TaxID=403957 RepID=UPI0004D11B57|nr:CaiB/BaiF CoA-transferase family protein [Virgibacillus sp. SK37]AIF42508.1 CoA transferase [Virgibacillus sp. SK37]